MKPVYDTQAMSASIAKDQTFQIDAADIIVLQGKSALDDTFDVSEDGGVTWRSVSARESVIFTSGQPVYVRAVDSGMVVGIERKTLSHFLGDEGERLPIVTAVTGPGGGALFSAGGNQVPSPVTSASLAFIGDSRVRYGYEYWARVAGTSDNKGLRIDWLGAGPMSVAGTTGVFEYRATDRHVRWTSPGDTAGPWVPLQVGEMKLESGSVDQWLRVVVLSLLRLPTTDKTVAIQTYSLISSTTRWSSVTVDVCSRLKKHRRTDVARLGAGGARTDDCVELLPWYERMAGGPGVDVIRLGANNISSFPLEYTTAIAEARKIFDARRKLGRKLVICGEPARWGVDTSTAITADQLTALHAINAAYRAYAAEFYADCRYVDLYAISRDPDYLDGRPAAGVLKDPVHDSDSGAELFGAAVYAALQSLGLRDDLPPAEDVTDKTLTWMTGTGGTASTSTTGPVPTSWIVRRITGTTAVNVASIVNFPDRSGRRIQVDVTTGEDGTNRIEVYSSTLTLADLGLSVGDAVEISADVEIVSGAPVLVEVFPFIVGTNRKASIFMPKHVGRFVGSGVPIEILPTDTGISLKVYVDIPANSTASFRVGEYAIRKVPAI